MKWIKHYLRKFMALLPDIIWLAILAAALLYVLEGIRTGDIYVKEMIPQCRANYPRWQHSLTVSTIV